MIAQCALPDDHKGSLQRKLIGPLFLFAVGAFSLPANASAGWYLLSPPSKSGVARDLMDALVSESRDKSKTWSEDQAGGLKTMLEPNSGAPLALWVHERSFDTAADCEAGRKVMVETITDNYERAKNSQAPKSPSNIVALEIMVEMAQGARCIASDDPRLLAR